MAPDHSHTAAEHTHPLGLHGCESEQNFQTFIETIDDLVLIGDMEGRILYSNPATTLKLGFSPEELREMRILELHPEWAREEATRILQEMFEGTRAACPLPLRSKSDQILPVETRVWSGKWNGVNCIFGLCKDLSTEQELLQKFEKMFRVNPAPMAITDMATGRFQEINQAFLDTLGYTREEVVGRTSAELNLTPAQEEHTRAAAMLKEYGTLQDLEMPVMAKDGTLHTGLFSGSIIKSQGREFMLTVMIDISRQKQAERDREQTIVELRSALEQIKTLQGILPMCASCKKIRDDKGYWEQVEAYISRHTDAQFSHGICPECKERLYPGLGK